MLLFAGGDCAEDIQANLKNDLSNVVNMKMPSADSILRLQKELSIAKEIHISKSNSTNEFSKHAKLNALNLEILLKTKALESDKSYDIDFDNQFVPCEKYDSKKSYKMKVANSDVSTIRKNIVYLENRNGNSNEK